jgi:hypothetical protein
MVYSSTTSTATAATATGSSSTATTSSSVASTVKTLATNESGTLVTPAVAATATPAAAAAAPIAGVVGFFNNIVTTLLNPFLAPAPNTPGPVVPIAWAVLGWVRRNLFNEAPTATYDPTTTTQTGQTITGTIVGTDPEGDPLTYTVTQQPTHGTVTIDPATGKFTYTLTTSIMVRRKRIRSP